jgi:hypothetical protein
MQLGTTIIYFLERNNMYKNRNIYKICTKGGGIVSTMIFNMQQAHSVDEQNLKQHVPNVERSHPSLGCLASMHSESLLMMLKQDWRGGQQRASPFFPTCVSQLSQ